MFNELAFRLYRALPRDENCFFSPLSIGAMLSALVVGARGRTAEELGRVLGVQGDDPGFPERVGSMLADLSARRGKTWEPEGETGEYREVEKDYFRLHIANALFAQSGYRIESSYREMLSSRFGAELFELDFRRRNDSATQINDWVKHQTRGKITQLVSPDAIHDLTRLILANAVYFLAEWRYQFKPGATRPAPFFLLQGGERETVEVPMMRTTENFACIFDRNLALQAIELPYDAMSMLVILPEPGQFRQVEDRLNADVMTRIVEGLQHHRVCLELPKFSMEAEYELAGPLRGLGVKTAFDRENADFTGISDDPQGLAVDFLFHKARIRVDEQGTEAAAATAVGMTALGLETEEPIPFVVNRPFIFCIRDPEMETVLFLGRVTNPPAISTR